MFLLGAAVGTGVTYLRMRKIVDDELERINEDVLEELDSFSGENRGNRVHLKPVDDAMNVEEEVFDKVRRNYSTFTDEEDSIEDEIESRRRERKRSKNTVPYMITVDEYDNEQENDKVEWVYYSGDDVMVDENEEVVDYYNAVGDFVTTVSPSEEDNDMIFIRNDNLEIDYLIEISEDTYACAVQGICEDGEM